MKLIVGLGNPGSTYTWTRHNLGFMVVGSLEKPDKCSLLMPQTFMNNSGAAVKAAVKKSGIALEDILIVYDDIALEFGQMRLKPEGSAGGHNGIKSIIEHLGTKEFARLRLGVGRPRPGVDAADYVLSNFTSAEKKLLPDFINQAHECVHSWVNLGVEEVMNQFNKRLNKRNQHE